MSLYLQLGRGLSADIAGLILIVQPALQAALSPVAGRLSDKKPPATIASLGMACCAAALIMFVFLDKQTPIPYVIAGLLLTGFGIAFFSSPNSNVILGSVSNKDYGVASSMISTARTYGQVIGMAILTMIMHLVIGDKPVAEVGPSVLITDMRISYIVFAGICIAGVLISLRRRER
jgi:MFS family permease